MQPPVPVTFVWDNGDHNPESVNGVLLHCTNGIMMQLQEDRPSPVASTDVIVTENAESRITQSRTSKRRSFQPIQSVIKPYTGGKRQNPKVIPALKSSSIELTSSLSAMLDKIWCLARLHSWTTTGTKKFQTGQDLTTLSTNTNGHSSRRLKSYRSGSEEAFSRGGRFCF